MFSEAVRFLFLRCAKASVVNLPGGCFIDLVEGGESTMTTSWLSDCTPYFALRDES